MLRSALSLFIFVAFAIQLHAQLDPTLSIQGILKKSNGAAVDDGAYSITFKLYAAAAGGAALWTETQSDVEVSSGIYSAALGVVTPLNVPFNQLYYLGVTVGSTELTPRVLLTSAPYALSLIGQSNKFPSAGGGGTGQQKSADSRGPIEPSNFWTIDPTQFESSMTLIGMLKVNGVNATTATMELGAFVGSQVRGSAQAIYIPPLQSYLFFLTTYANSSGEQIKFKLFDSSTGEVQELNELMYFSSDLHQGSIDNPVPFTLLSSGTQEAAGVQSFEVQPNPFQTETMFRFALPSSQEIALTITDASGKLVSTVHTTAQDGLNTVVWRGKSDSGAQLPSGVYFVRLQTESGSVVKKVVLQPRA